MLDTRKTGLIQHNPPSLSRNELYVSAAPVETKPAIRVSAASRLDKFGISQDLTEVNSETVVTVPRMVQQPVLGPRPLALANGNFSLNDDGSWTKGTGWTIANGRASSDASQAGDSDLTQTPIPALAAGGSYSITIEVKDYVAGNVTPVVGDVEGTDRAADGVFTETIVAGAGADIDIRADVTFDGSVSLVSVERLAGDFSVGEHVVLVSDAVGEDQTTNPEFITNGDFATDTVWTKGTGWTIATDVASSDGTQLADSDLTQTPATPALIIGKSYSVTFTVTAFTAGNITAVVGGTEGTDRAATGTFTEIIVAGAGADFDMRADVDFIGSIDNITVKQLGGVGGGTQWQLDASDIVGEVNSILVLANIQVADGGVYTCDFTNPAGTTVSASITLTVT